jgi:hypothetical protein
MATIPTLPRDVSDLRRVQRQQVGQRMNLSAIGRGRFFVMKTLRTVKAESDSCLFDQNHSC